MTELKEDAFDRLHDIANTSYGELTESDVIAINQLEEDELHSIAEVASGQKPPNRELLAVITGEVVARWNRGY